MKPIEAIFRNGRLYDLTTNQSINLREDAKIILIVDLPDHLNSTDAESTSTVRRKQQQPSTGKQVVVNSSNDSIIPNTASFRKALHQLLQHAQEQGLPSIDVNAGQFHTQVGGYPGRNNRMPTCTAVLKKAMREGDTLLEDTEKGAGASVTIKYKLPR